MAMMGELAPGLREAGIPKPGKLGKLRKASAP
jgi:hypothetical protein